MAACGSLEFGGFLGASSGGWAGLTALHVCIKLRIASPPVSFPTRVVVQKALYRFVGTCERSMRVRVVGVAFLFPGRERANGSCDNFDAYA